MNNSTEMQLTEHQISGALYALTTYIIPCICCVGIVCNLLNIVVLSRKHMKESPYTYLMGLAVADLTVLVMTFTHSVFYQQFGRGSYGWSVYDAYIFLPVGNTFANASIFITVLLTTERWISVRFPLKAKDLCTRSLARKAVMGTFVVTAVLNIPRAFCRTLQLAPNSTDEYQVIQSDFESSTVYKAIMWFYITAILIIPCSILVALNSALVWLVYKATVNRTALLQSSRAPQHDLHASREQTRLTVTCISIIVLFLICMLPAAVTNPNMAFALFGPDDGSSEHDFVNSPLYTLIRTVNNTLVVLNLSLNFVLYCCFNNKFTRTLRFLFSQNIACFYCTQTAQRRSSRRSTTSSSSFRRHSNYRWSRHGSSRHSHRAHAPFAQQWNALYFNLEVYPLTNVSPLSNHRTCHRPDESKKRFHTELFSQTEVSEL